MAASRSRSSALALLVVVLVAAAAFAPASAQLPTIYDVVSKDGSFNTLTQGMQKAGLAAAFSNPNLNPKLTCFAPTDAAFAAVAKKFGVTPDVAFGNKNLLGQVINLHLLPKPLTIAQLLKDPLQDTRASGYKLIATPIGGTPTPTNAQVSLRNIANPPCPVVKPNMAASNGIVHGINGILLPFKLPGKKL
jgi:uncharacterized surface protein with fasciclin (FAS1) repeats